MFFFTKKHKPYLFFKDVKNIKDGIFTYFGR